MTGKTTQARTWEEITEAISLTSPLMATAGPDVARTLTRAAWIVGHIDRDRVRMQYGQEGVSALVKAARGVRSVVEGTSTVEEAREVAAGIDLARLEDMNTRTKLELPPADPWDELSDVLSGGEGCL